MALVMVDPQRKFTLKVPDWEQRMGAAVEGMNRFSKLFREYGAPVVLVRFEGRSHCGYEKDDGDEWLPGLVTEPTDIVVPKKNMSCFKETDLLEVLREKEVDCALYVGMLAEFCVISTYFASSERGIVPYIGKGATIAYNPNGNEAIEVVCGVADADVVERLLAGKQPEPSMEFERGRWVRDSGTGLSDLVPASCFRSWRRTRRYSWRRNRIPIYLPAVLRGKGCTSCCDSCRSLSRRGSAW